jgi:type I restriction enzyme R subunit
VQTQWLNRIEKYLVHESVFNQATFDEDDRFRRAGGFARLDRQFFGGQLAQLVDELNDYLYEDTPA